jgi:hypothetical protein
VMCEHASGSGVSKHDPKEHAARQQRTPMAANK